MKCYHCGQETENGSENCLFCGAYQGAGATVLLDQVFNPYATEQESGRTDTLPENRHEIVCADRYANDSRPKIQFSTQRSLLKMILLGLATFGIYDVVIWSKMITELNIAASRYDGKRTMPYFAMVTLAPITLGIYAFVWSHKLCNRIGDELVRRGSDYKFRASAFWLWNVLGSLILVGPFVFLYKIVSAMNLINADFNQYG